MCLLSEAARVYAAYVALLLQMACMVLGGFLLAAGIYLKVVFEEYENMKYEYIGEAFPNFLIVVGVLQLVYHLVGVQASITATDWRKVYRNKAIHRSMTFFFIIVNIIFIFVLFITAVLLVSFPKILREAWTKLLKEKLRNYASNLDNKIMIDHIQFNYRCCGAANDADWHKVAWLRDGKIPVDNNYNNIKAQVIRGYFKGEGVPWSCCNVMATLPCINMFYTEESRHDNYNSDVDRSIYKRGCGYAISKEIGYWLAILGKATFLFLVVEILSLVVFRLLQTSTELALAWGDPTQAAQGYLLICGVPPVPPGATLDPGKLAIRQKILDDLANNEESFEAVEKLKLGLMNRAWKMDSSKDRQELEESRIMDQSEAAISNNNPFSYPAHHESASTSRLINEKNKKVKRKPSLFRDIRVLTEKNNTHNNSQKNTFNAKRKKDKKIRNTLHKTQINRHNHTRHNTSAHKASCIAGHSEATCSSDTIEAFLAKDSWKDTHEHGSEHSSFFSFKSPVSPPIFNYIDGDDDSMFESVSQRVCRKRVSLKKEKSSQQKPHNTTHPSRREVVLNNTHTSTICSAHKEIQTVNNNEYKNNDKTHHTKGTNTSITTLNCTANNMQTNLYNLKGHTNTNNYKYIDTNNHTHSNKYRRTHNKIHSNQKVNSDEIHKIFGIFSRSYDNDDDNGDEDDNEDDEDDTRTSDKRKIDGALEVNTVDYNNRQYVCSTIDDENSNDEDEEDDDDTDIDDYADDIEYDESDDDEDDEYDEDDENGGGEMETITSLGERNFRKTKKKDRISVVEVTKIETAKCHGENSTYSKNDKDTKYENYDYEKNEEEEDEEADKTKILYSKQFESKDVCKQSDGGTPSDRHLECRSRKNNRRVEENEEREGAGEDDSISNSMSIHLPDKCRLTPPSSHSQQNRKLQQKSKKLQHKTSQHLQQPQHKTSQHLQQPQHKTSQHLQQPQHKTSQHPPQPQHKTSQHLPQPQHKTSQHLQQPQHKTSQHLQQPQHKTSQHLPQPQHKTSQHLPQPQHKTSQHLQQPQHKTSQHLPQPQHKTSQHLQQPQHKTSQHLPQPKQKSKQIQQPHKLPLRPSKVYDKTFSVFQQKQRVGVEHLTQQQSLHFHDSKHFTLKQQKRYKQHSPHCSHQTSSRSNEMVVPVRNKNHPKQQQPPKSPKNNKNNKQYGNDTLSTNFYHPKREKFISHENGNNHKIGNFSTHNCYRSQIGGACSKRQNEIDKRETKGGSGDNDEDLITLDVSSESSTLTSLNTIRSTDLIDFQDDNLSSSHNNNGYFITDIDSITSISEEDHRNARKQNLNQNLEKLSYVKNFKKDNTEDVCGMGSSEDIVLWKETTC